MKLEEYLWLVLRDGQSYKMMNTQIIILEHKSYRQDEDDNCSGFLSRLSTAATTGVDSLAHGQL